MHSATRILESRPAESGRVRVKLELACGCTFEGEIAADRLLETEGGAVIPVGKYPCPQRHPVVRPAGA